MAMQYSETVRNAALDSVETTIGVDAILKIFDGTKPANCGTADAGTVLATMTLPTDWMAAASGGSKALAGTWEDTSADASGTAQYFRVYNSAGTVCHIQGSITTTAVGTGDMLLDNTSIAAGQSITITAFTLSASGA